MVSLPKKPKDSQNKEAKCYGLHTCEAIFRERKESVIRAYITEQLVSRFKQELHWCAKNRKAYHIVTSAELEKITHSTHHEGICLLVREKQVFSQEDYLQTIKNKQNQKKSLLFLAGTGNHHNVGAILRSAAHFGLTHLAFTGELAVAGSLARVSEGGCEQVDMVRVTSPVKFLQQLQKSGYKILAATQKATTHLYKVEWPKNVVLVVGNEIRGIPADIVALADQTFVIPGTGKVESLNVSVACGILLGEWYRHSLGPSA